MLHIPQIFFLQLFFSNTMLYQIYNILLYTIYYITYYTLHYILEYTCARMHKHARNFRLTNSYSNLYYDISLLFNTILFN